MAREEQDDEVAEHFAVEHGGEVELDVALPDERRGVAQQAQGAAVGQQGPQCRVGPVEVLLHERVRGTLRGAGYACGALVEIDVPAKQV